MSIVVAVAVLAFLALVGWIIFRAFRDKAIKAHTISYGMSVIAGIFTYAYFLSLDFPRLIKIVVSIILGIILIIIGAFYQRRAASKS
jgi:hypothetical protein